MSARFRDIPPRAVSQLFGLCANAPEGVLRPSLYDDGLTANTQASNEFSSNRTLGRGIADLNWQHRMENAGYLVSAGQNSEAAREKQKKEFDAYFLQNWLSRMSESYQRSYRELMRTVERVEKFCDHVHKELAEQKEIVDRELGRLKGVAVQINGQEFIPDGHGGYMDIYGRPLNSRNTKKEVLEEVDSIYKKEPWRVRELESMPKLIETSKSIDSTALQASELRQDAQDAKQSRPDNESQLQDRNDKLNSKEQGLNGNLKMIREVTKAIPTASGNAFSLKNNDADIFADEDEGTRPSSPSSKIDFSMASSGNPAEKTAPPENSNPDVFPPVKATAKYLLQPIEYK